MTHDKVDSKLVVGKIQLVEGLFVRILFPPGHRPQAYLAYHEVALAKLAVAAGRQGGVGGLVRVRPRDKS